MDSHEGNGISGGNDEERVLRLYQFARHTEFGMLRTLANEDGEVGTG